MFGKVGQILVSAPSSAAVDNIANRIHWTSRTVIARCNDLCDFSKVDPCRRRNTLVIRGYEEDDELRAFLHLLKYPADDDMNLLARGVASHQRWQPSLSVAVWLLALLRSQAICVPELQPEDKASLHGLRGYIDSRPDLHQLREVATGACSWADFAMDPAVLKEKVKALMSELVKNADFLCTTSAMSNNCVAYKQFKDRKAKGIVVDEAAGMNRADLACLWGNTLLPCFLGGDPKQLPPALLSTSAKDTEGNIAHRFAHDASISALEFLQASGYPVCRLTTQLRMANGLFDWIADAVYKDVPFTYGECCDIDLPAFKIGRQLESFIARTYPDVARPPPGKLWPAFIDCVGSFVAVDKSTGSRLCRDQVKVALDFAAQLVRAESVDPAKITILAPYAANVSLISKMRKKPEYEVLKGLPNASTVDAYQGMENDIIIVVMGTAFPRPGFGFTAVQSRLNTLFTRQRCGLVIVGDIGMEGVVDVPNGKGKRKRKRKTEASEVKAVAVETLSGDRVMVRPTALLKMYRSLYRNKRVGSVVVRDKDNSKGGNEGNGYEMPEKKPQGKEGVNAYLRGTLTLNY